MGVPATGLVDTSDITKQDIRPAVQSSTDISSSKPPVSAMYVARQIA